MDMHRTEEWMARIVDVFQDYKSINKRFSFGLDFTLMSTRRSSPYRVFSYYLLDFYSGCPLGVARSLASMKRGRVPIFLRTAEFKSCSSGLTRPWLLTLAAGRVAWTHIIKCITGWRFDATAAGPFSYDLDESSIYGNRSTTFFIVDKRWRTCRRIFSCIRALLVTLFR